MPTPERRAVVTTELMLVGMALIWGFNFAVLKYGTQVLAPLAYNGVRMLVGALALVAITLPDKKNRPAPKDIGRLALLGVLGHGVYQALFIQGISRTRAGTASLVIAASPAVIAIVSRVLTGERATRMQVMGIAASIAGIAFVILGSAASGANGDSAFGDLLILGSVVAWGFYTVWLRPMTHHIEGIQIAAWTLVGGAVPMALLSLPAIMATDWTRVTPLTWGAILYSGLGAMGVAYLAWYRGVRVIGPTRTAMFSNLQPIVAVGVAWPLLGEKPTIWQGVGALGVIAGVLLTRSNSAPEPAHCE